MKILILKDNPEDILSEKLLNAFKIPTNFKTAKDIYKADALILIWDGTDKNKQRVKETAVKLRKPIYEILYDDNKNLPHWPTKYIRRLPNLK